LRSHVSSELHPSRPSQSNSARLGPKCDRLCIVSPLKLSIGGPIYSSSPTTATIGLRRTGSCRNLQGKRQP
jgi:hypothetical protein